MALTAGERNYYYSLLADEIDKVMCTLTVSLRKPLHQIYAPGTEGQVCFVLLAIMKRILIGCR